MANTNRERIEAALDAFVDGMAPFVERAMEARYKAGWRGEVERIRRNNPPGFGKPIPGTILNWETTAIIDVILSEWRQIFQSKFTKGQRGMLNEVSEIRNNWAHQGPFTTDLTARALDTIHRLLRAVSADQAVAVHDMLREVRTELTHEADAPTARCVPAENAPGTPPPQRDETGPAVASTSIPNSSESTNLNQELGADGVATDQSNGRDSEAAKNDYVSLLPRELREQTAETQTVETKPTLPAADATHGSTAVAADPESAFHDAMVRAYHHLYDRCRYNARYFSNMLRTLGGVTTARELISKPGEGRAFQKMRECGCLELSVEHHILRPEFANLFTAEQREIARRRLRAAGFEAAGAAIDSRAPSDPLVAASIGLLDEAVKAARPPNGLVYSYFHNEAARESAMRNEFALLGGAKSTWPVDAGMVAERQLAELWDFYNVPSPSPPALCSGAILETVAQSESFPRLLGCSDADANVLCDVLMNAIARIRELGGHRREYSGVAKFLHFLRPDSFALIDTNAARSIGTWARIAFPSDRRERSRFLRTNEDKSGRDYRSVLDFYRCVWASVSPDRRAAAEAAASDLQQLLRVHRRNAFVTVLGLIDKLMWRANGDATKLGLKEGSS